jgi:hypothetical protein
MSGLLGVRDHLKSLLLVFSVTRLMYENIQSLLLCIETDAVAIEMKANKTL